MIKVHFAAHAFPAGNWNDGLDTRCFRQLCDRDGFLPIDFKRIGTVRHRASAADIETEHAQFEFVWAAFKGVYWGRQCHAKGSFEEGVRIQCRRLRRTCTAAFLKK